MMTSRASTFTSTFFLLFSLLFLTSSLFILCSSSSISLPKARSPFQYDDSFDSVLDVVFGLIERQYGSVGLTPDLFQFEYTPPSSTGQDAWQLDWNATSSKPILRGSSAIALSVALRTYLETYCNAQLSWTGDQLDVLAQQVVRGSLPRPDPLQGERPYQYSYYENVCTVSYSMAFWNWSRWEREIDWMALNGINLPLAFTGQEYVWLRVYENFNLSKDSIIDFFGGPSFFAWQRMGNIQGAWPSPLPEEFIDQQFQLQIQILTRMQEFKMSPVLPGFAGHVPSAFQSAYPKANITESPEWANFNYPSPYCCVSLLDPTDPLFVAIGSAFIKEQMSLYNSYGINVSHIYNIDTYNEMSPPTNNASYLAIASKAVFDGIQEADPEGIWLMQGWLFYSQSYFWTPPVVEAYLSGVPDDKMIILDLYAEYAPVWNITQGFFGKKWIWCMLHNFGGQLGLYGMLPSVATNPLIARASSVAGTNMIGMGLTMEGIDQNYVVYDLALKMSWSTESPDLNQFIDQFVARRYGDSPSQALSAWRILQNTVYNSTRGGGVTKSEIVVVPEFDIYTYAGQPTALFYDPAYLVVAWNDLINCTLTASNIVSTETFQYDLVDVGRQVLSDLFIPLQQLFATEYKDSNSSSVLTAVATQMLNIIEDMDTLMSSNSHTLLGSWIEEARSWAGGDEDLADYYDYQARNQITMWGPTGQISDYASKMWGGLVKDYYLPRWQLFFSEVIGNKASGQAFNQTQFYSDLLVFEEYWNNSTDPYPSTPMGDPLEVSVGLYQKYLPIICKYYNLTILNQLC